MNFLRNSIFLKAFCLVMASLILFISCDPNTHLLNEKIDKQAEDIIEEYSSNMTAQDCQNFKNSIDQLKAYIWLSRKNGINPSREDLAKYVYDMGVTNGAYAYNAPRRQAFADFAKNNTWSGDQSEIIIKLNSEQLLSSGNASLLQDFRVDMENVSTYSQAFSVIDDMRLEVNNSSLTTAEKDAFQFALDGAERTVCHEDLLENEISTAVWCEECSWHLHWQALVISVVVTIIVWVLAVATLGLSLIVTSVVLFFVWIATWSLICITVWCDDNEGLCESGQPICEGSLIFDENIPACTGTFPVGAIEWGNCIQVRKPSSGICPPGTIFDQGAYCILECFTVQPAMNDQGNWQLPFTCQ